MKEITVNYLAQLKQATGISSENITLNTPCSISELVTIVAEKHGEPLRSFLLDSSDNLRSNILLIIGDTQVHWEAQVQIKEGDSVTFLSPLAGG
jgi:molybdopterin converting factor small subunit